MESPNRNLVFRGKEATAENYRKMFSSFKVEGFQRPYSASPPKSASLTTASSQPS